MRLYYAHILKKWWTDKPLQWQHVSSSVSLLISTGTIGDSWTLLVRVDVWSLWQRADHLSETDIFAIANAVHTIVKLLDFETTPCRSPLYDLLVQLWGNRPMHQWTVQGATQPPVSKSHAPVLFFFFTSKPARSLLSLFAHCTVDMVHGRDQLNSDCSTGRSRV